MLSSLSQYVALAQMAIAVEKKTIQLVDKAK